MKNNYRNRISDSALKEIESLDDLMKNKLNIEDTDKFKKRLDFFKDYLKESLPDFDLEDILFFDKHLNKFKEIYSWDGISELLTAIEYELIKVNHIILNQVILIDFSEYDFDYIKAVNDFIVRSDNLHITVGYM